jgi:hypothetical protein
MADGFARVVLDSLRAATPTPSRNPLPTIAELSLERNREAFARTAKYPIRAFAVMTPAQLAATRALLGAAGFGARGP